MWLHCFQSWALAWAFLHLFTRGDRPWDLVTAPGLARGCCHCLFVQPQPQGHRVSAQVCKKWGHWHGFLLFSSKVVISWDLWVREIRWTETHQGKGANLSCDERGVCTFPSPLGLCYDALVIKWQTGWKYPHWCNFAKLWLGKKHLGFFQHAHRE